MNSFKNSNEKLKIIYIGGYGRSGSTLLDIILSDSQKVVGLGEISNFYNMACCPDFDDLFSHGRWSAIREQVAKCLTSDNKQIRGEIFKDRYDVQKSFEHIVRGSLSLFFYSKKRFGEYKKSNDCLFQEIVNSYGEGYIYIDSSKTAWMTSWRPYFLRKIGYDVKIIHLVRDGRGIISSFLKGDNQKIEKGSKDVSFRVPVIRSIIGWIGANIVAYLNGLFLKKDNYLLLRYEDMLDNPKAQLDKIGDYLKLDLDDTINKILHNEPLYIEDDRISGNRLRNRKSIRLDSNSAKTVSLRKKDACLYWVTAGWLHWLIYFRFKNKIGPKQIR